MAAMNFLPRCIAFELQIFNDSIGIRLKNAVHLGKKFLTTIFSATSIVAFSIQAKSETATYNRVMVKPSNRCNGKWTSTTIFTRGGGYFTINLYGGVRRKDFCYDSIPEIWSDIDTQSQNFEEVTKTIQRQRDKGLRAGNENFCLKWPLEQSSDLSTFLNAKNT